MTRAERRAQSAPPNKNHRAVERREQQQQQQQRKNTQTFRSTAERTAKARRDLENAASTIGFVTMDAFYAALANHFDLKEHISMRWDFLELYLFSQMSTWSLAVSLVVTKLHWIQLHLDFSCNNWGLLDID